MARLDTLVRRAVETIALLKRDKHELSARLAQVEELLEQERSNTRQRDKLFQSNKSEVDHFEGELTELKAVRQAQESLIAEQSGTITKLEEELTAIASKLAETEQLVVSGEVTSALQGALETKLLATSNERDEMRARLYQVEREAAGWVVTLNKEDAKKAEKAIDMIIKRIDQVEKRVGLSQKNGAVDATVEPEILTAD
jgi:chromosome segregation ATPase